MPQSLPFLRLANAICLVALASAPALSFGDSYTQTNLVSNIPGMAANTDPNLRNPWGISNSQGSPFWTADQVTGVSTLYNGAGTPLALIVTIPSVPTGARGPTGTVFNNATAGFNVNGTKSNFIFDTLQGTIAAWNSSAGTTAVTMATTPGAIYTGLAQNNTSTGTFLYAANSSQGKIDVFDANWAPASGFSFTDPNGISGFVPFNVQAVGSNLFVTYAHLGPGGTPLPGGYVDEFDSNGNLIKRIATSGSLFAPWGISIAPAGFGTFSNDLLIGNFGNGEILAYDATSDLFLGTLNGTNGNPIVNDHLWALETRNATGFDPSALYFTAGINNQADGLFGELTVVTPEPASIISTATGLIALAFAGLRRRFSTN